MDKIFIKAGDYLSYLEGNSFIIEKDFIIEKHFFEKEKHNNEFLLRKEDVLFKKELIVKQEDDYCSFLLKDPFYCIELSLEDKINLINESTTNALYHYNLDDIYYKFILFYLNNITRIKLSYDYFSSMRIEEYKYFSIADGQVCYHKNDQTVINRARSNEDIKIFSLPYCHKYEIQYHLVQEGTQLIDWNMR